MEVLVGWGVWLSVWAVIDVRPSLPLPPCSGDEAEASLTPEQQLLRNLISSSLADHLKQLEVMTCKK